MSQYKDNPPPYPGHELPPPPGVHQYYGPPGVPPPGTAPYPPGTAPYPPGPPQAGDYYGPPPPNPGYGATAATVIVTQPDVVIIGGCPSCRVGVLEEDFTCCGVMCAICFFPLGILCCLLMREKKCSNCGASF